MSELDTPATPAEVAPFQPPTLEEVYSAVQQFSYHEGKLWRAHHDTTRISEPDTEQSLNSFLVSDAEKLERGLDVLQRAEGHFDTAEYPWFPKSTTIIHRAIGSAEAIRRKLSEDVYMMSDSLPKVDTEEVDTPVSKSAQQYKHSGLRANLRGAHPSTVGSTVRQANMSNDFRELTPLESEREYHEVTPHDIELLVEEAPVTFVRFAADILSPIRNEHMVLSDGVLGSVANIITARREEIGALGGVLLLNCWRLAKHNGNNGVAEAIQTSLSKDSPMRHFMETYQPQDATYPSHETLKRNATTYFDQYVDAGGDTGELQSPQADRPRVRMRLKPETLWSIAMRDGGFIRTGAEGAARKSGRGTEGVYAYRRKQVEATLYGDAALDEIQDVPIVYGYYANEETEQTVAMQSMSRIYGGIELIFKDELPVDKRIIYGDSMNAVGIEANNQPVTPESVAATLDKRVIAEEDVAAMAHVIATLHGNEENTEFKPSANPYIECLLRGRLSLGDCQEIRVPAYTYDGNTSLMAAISKKFGLSIIRVEPSQ